MDRQSGEHLKMDTARYHPVAKARPRSQLAVKKYCQIRLCLRQDTQDDVNSPRDGTKNS